MKIGMRGAAVSLLALAMAAPVLATAQQSAAAAANKETSVLTSEREKIGYAVGIDVASSFEPLADMIDLAALRAAIENAFAGNEPVLSQEEAQATDGALRMAMMAKSGQPIPGMAPGTEAPKPDAVKVAQLLGGYAVGPSLAQIKDDISLDALFTAVGDVFGKRDLRITRDQAMAELQAFAQAKAARAGEENRRAGAEFLAANKNQPGVVTTASGLQYQVLRAGSGEQPSAGSRVRVNYEGKLLSGEVFDSSYARGEPAEFGLNQVIAGWTEGVALMPVGAKYRFWIPSELAYGANGAPGGKIGPDSTLTFDVELLGVMP
jgi:FKBP-type peptidyl-prolyl cis-trans isomerase FkpA